MVPRTKIELFSCPVFGTVHESDGYVSDNVPDREPDPVPSSSKYLTVRKKLLQF